MTGVEGEVPPTVEGQAPEIEAPETAQAVVPAEAPAPAPVPELSLEGTESQRPGSPPAPGRGGVDDATVMKQIQQFLDDWHYKALDSGLARKWNRKEVARSLLRFFDLEGGALGEEAVQALEASDESEMIYGLVARLPAEFKLQLEQVMKNFQDATVNATTMLRGLQAQKPETLVDCLDDPESAYVAQEVLKQAAISASKQATKTRLVHLSWATNTELRLQRLAKFSEDAVRAQRELAAVQTQLESFGEAQKSKTKGVLMSVASGQDNALVKSIFGNWVSYVMKVRAEKVLREKFENEIAEAERKLFEYKERQLANVKGILNKSAAAGRGALVGQVWAAWRADLDDIKKEREVAALMGDAQQKLNAATSAQKENTKQFMARMAANGDTAMITLVFQSWQAWLVEYRKDKELEDQVKEAEKMVQQYLKEKSEGAKGVLDRMSSGSDSGLLAVVVQNWLQVVVDEKKAAEMDAKMAEQQAKFGALNGRQKGAATNVQQRINQQQNTNMAIAVLLSWAQEAKEAKVIAFYTQKCESKKKQLDSIHKMFQSFASQLDHGLGAESDSARKSGRRASQKEPKSGADTGRQVLPDIHGRPAVA